MHFDIIYLNSFHAPLFSIFPLVLRRLAVLRSAPVILAPRGEFGEGALLIKRWKKVFYRCISGLLGLYRNIVWQASSNVEAEQIRRYQPLNSNEVVVAVMVAPDLPIGVERSPEHSPIQVERKTYLRICFVGRIVRIKNLDYALRILSRLKTDIEFNIFGPEEDLDYARQCKALAGSLPNNIRAIFRGSVDHAQLVSILSEQDLFFLPTKGENFGHAIWEALAAGLPVLISDQTPWRQLEIKEAGWDIPLNAEESYVRAIESVVAWDADEQSRRRIAAQHYARESLGKSDAVEQNKALFQRCLTQ
jgi:glycosyltransferase involved in cell wall biosynthesis